MGAFSIPPAKHPQARQSCRAQIHHWMAAKPRTHGGDAQTQPRPGCSHPCSVPSLSMHPGSVCLAGISGSREERLSKGLCFTAEEEENRRCPAAGGQTMELGAQYRGLPWCKDVLHLYPIFSLKVPGVYHPPFSTLSSQWSQEPTPRVRFRKGHMEIPQLTTRTRKY